MSVLLTPINRKMRCCYNGGISIVKLSYNKVFNRYTTSFSDKLTEAFYSLYKSTRLQLENIFPLSQNEKYNFEFVKMGTKKALCNCKGLSTYNVWSLSFYLLNSTAT